MALLKGRRALATIVCAASAWALAGCQTTPNRAPVEDHGAHANGQHPAAATDMSKVAAAAASTTPAEETRAPTYTVKQGDTLMRIALDSGQSWRDLARWNNVDNPDHIEVGQVLRVIAPPAEASAPAASASAPTFKPAPAASAPAPAPSPGRTELKPIDPKAASAGGSASAASVPLTGVAPPAPAARDNDDDLVWNWPAAGPVIANFDEAKTKGLSISGKTGDPVYAAADGRVVYAGSGLRGYGNLVIVKHNANYLTAYAHNQTLLVKEDQIVKRGQKIAEMGSTDADRVQLHFEIRKQGKPIDPARLLPPR